MGIWTSRLFSLGTGVTAMLAAAVAPAGVVTLANSSFETPVLTAGSPLVGSITGWTGSYLGTALASSYSLVATNGVQVAYNQNSPGQNYIMTQATATPLATATAYNLIADLRPLVNDPVRNCAGLEVSRTTFGVNYATAYFNSVNFSPGSFSSANSFTLAAGQWTTAAAGFDTRDYPADVSGGQLLQPIIRGFNMAVDNVRLYSSPNTYHISFSTGNDLNDGLTPATAWKTFSVINQMTLGPGDQVMLKRGDTWSGSNLSLRGKGAAGNLISLGAYGTGPDPLITGADLTTATCITLLNPSYVSVRNMDCRNAKVGLYLRYAGGNLDGTGAMFNNQSVTIEGCNFQNMDEVWSDANGAIAVMPPYELSWGAGIWLGGSIPDNGTPVPPVSTTTPILNGLTIRNCSFPECSTGFGDNFYFPRGYKSRIANFLMEDCWVSGCENGSVAITYVDGGTIRRVDSILGGNGFYASGTTGAFVQYCKNVVFDDCEFAFNKRPSTSNDGTGIDFEGASDNITMTNCVLHDNDGGGILVLDSTGLPQFVGDNTNLQMNSNTVYNNCRNPRGGSSSQNKELRYPNTGSTGSFTNNGVYLGTNAGSGTLAVFDNATNWNDFTGSGATRTAASYASVSGRPSAWEFAAGLEGWNGFSANWGSPAAAGGFLTGTSTGADPYAESPATWINSRRNEVVLVRMSQTAGAFAQVFFQTETDQTWTAGKSVFFPITSDGVMRDYIVDLTPCAEFRGVVTRLRLDPTDAAGSAMSIDHVRFVSNPYLKSLAFVDAKTLEVGFNETMLITGGVLAPLNFTLSGSGKGTLANNPAVVSRMVGASGAITYRLTWTSGSMVPGTVTISGANATDVFGFPVQSATASLVVNPSGVADWQMF